MSYGRLHAAALGLYPGPDTGHIRVGRTRQYMSSPSGSASSRSASRTAGKLHRQSNTTHFAVPGQASENRCNCTQPSVVPQHEKFDTDTTTIIDRLSWVSWRKLTDLTKFNLYKHKLSKSRLAKKEILHRYNHNNGLPRLSLLAKLN